MGYNFTVKNAVRPKVEGHYPWPCESSPDRTILLLADDVLTKNPETGKYMLHTGLGCFNIILKDEEVTPIEGDVHLRLL